MSRFKLSVFTVSTPELTHAQTCEAAKEAGVEGIEWRCKETPAAALSESPSFWGNNRSTLAPSATAEELTSVRESIAKNGLRSIALVPYLTCGDLEGTEALFRLAKSIGASMIRVGVPGYQPEIGHGKLFESAVRYLDKVEGMAGEFGIKALIEIHHGTILPSASAAYRLASRYSPERIGVLLDPGNMIYEGMENFRMGMEILGPYLAHVHVKNAGWEPKRLLPDGSEHPNAAKAFGAPGPDGDPLAPVEWTCGWRSIASGAVPWKQILRDLDAVGYDGWLGVEDFSNTYSSPEMLRTFVKQIRTWEDELGLKSS
ncbi:sugar phosphate isomerase/epimerase family protein [Cohnella thailandensis]|uniref:Sugar phosphate isomerase/epimerase n=1 Tax=Cohnella thailandensis TaxID=557557 RepID=A0A841T0H2_9BACL|nr:sugar phosphate isomerase/epimerase [Cohnella thailandensis]MBB6635580.1 sugar phosphate isomerase/epimerase [Cohnella thailandensis]MBP1974960.1 sugar phosphate isomerase/epimerase [Cohnella thailandensis]